MSFENGYKAINYIGDLIDNYNKDTSIFIKALQIFNSYKVQSSWPHNYKAMNNALSLLMGSSHETVLNFSRNYLYLKNNRNRVADLHQIEWPENIDERFINELEIYYNLVSQEVEQAALARIKPLKFAGLIRSQLPMNQTKMLKLIRMDGEGLEFEVDRHDVESIIRTLEIMIQDSCEINSEV